METRMHVRRWALSRHSRQIPLHGANHFDRVMALKQKDPQTIISLGIFFYDRTQAQSGLHPSLYVKIDISPPATKLTGISSG